MFVIICKNIKVEIISGSSMLALGGRGRGLLLHAGQHTQVHWGESCEKSVSNNDDDNYGDNYDVNYDDSYDDTYDENDNDYNGHHAQVHRGEHCEEGVL